MSWWIICPVKSRFSAQNVLCCLDAVHQNTGSEIDWHPRAMATSVTANDDYVVNNIGKQHKMQMFAFANL